VEPTVWEHQLLLTVLMAFPYLRMDRLQSVFVTMAIVFATL
jgi:hypothetical protein